MHFARGNAAKPLGRGAKSDRTTPRWIGEDSHIPYGEWTLLFDFAGFGRIRKN
jgi:hypothetical protein